MGIMLSDTQGLCDSQRLHPLHKVRLINADRHDVIPLETATTKVNLSYLETD